MVQINWTFQAKDDLKRIAKYISKDSKRYALFQVLKLKQRTEILKTQVYSSEIVSEIDEKNIRELIESNYRIIYKIVSKKRVNIPTVHHTSRDLSKRTF